jgi:hypothetical protein
MAKVGRKYVVFGYIVSDGLKKGAERKKKKRGGWMVFGINIGSEVEVKRIRVGRCKTRRKANSVRKWSTQTNRRNGVGARESRVDK